MRAKNQLHKKQDIAKLRIFYRLWSKVPQSFSQIRLQTARQNTTKEAKYKNLDLKDGVYSGKAAAAATVGMVDAADPDPAGVGGHREADGRSRGGRQAHGLRHPEPGRRFNRKI